MLRLILQKLTWKIRESRVIKNALSIVSLQYSKARKAVTESSNLECVIVLLFRFESKLYLNWV